MLIRYTRSFDPHLVGFVAAGLKGVFLALGEALHEIQGEAPLREIIFVDQRAAHDVTVEGQTLRRVFDPDHGLLPRPVGHRACAQDSGGAHRFTCGLFPQVGSKSELSWGA
eukprot:1370769-Pyramimonas_sp.AAC.3